MARKYFEEDAAQEVAQEPTPVEAKAASALVAEAPKPMKVDFDAWWAMREKKIPGHHIKEIILADFKARKLSLQETMKSYDDALGKYGVKLK